MIRAKLNSDHVTTTTTAKGTRREQFKVRDVALFPNASKAWRCLTCQTPDTHPTEAELLEEHGAQGDGTPGTHSYAMWSDDALHPLGAGAGELVDGRGGSAPADSADPDGVIGPLI